MKKLLIIVSSLVVIGVIGYAVLYLISLDKKISSDSEEKSVELSDNQEISEWREEDRTGVALSGIPEIKCMRSGGNAKAQLFQQKVCFMYMMKRQVLWD